MKRIYETDSYIKEQKTVVTASGTDDGGRHYIELDDTIFFPEEGGQNADTGELLLCGTGSYPDGINAHHQLTEGRVLLKPVQKV